ncbi:MAG: hypothetical protein Q4P29_06190 [Tissierellia bacterium]|nr:hypothetical protein [Tissierellia bacterium]
MKNLTVAAILFFAILSLIIYLQINLSKKENKWLGLILPMMSFFLSLIEVFNIVITEDMKTLQIFSTIIGTFLINNISTLILLAIYWTQREKIRIKNEINKMNIKDL